MFANTKIERKIERGKTTDERALYSNSVEVIRCDRCEHEVVVFALTRNAASNEFMHCSYSKGLPAANDIVSSILIASNPFECPQLRHEDI